MCQCGEEDVSTTWARRTNEWRVFPRVFVGIFVYVFYDAFMWTKMMIEAGKLQGEWIGVAFIGSIVAGMVSIVKNYSAHAPPTIAQAPTTVDKPNV